MVTTLTRLQCHWGEVTDRRAGEPDDRTAHECTGTDHYRGAGPTACARDPHALLVNSNAALCTKVSMKISPTRAGAMTVLHDGRMSIGSSPEVPDGFGTPPGAGCATTAIRPTSLSRR